MEQQRIISIGREFGSGGHEVAALLAQQLGLPLYDRNVLDEVASTKNVDSNNLARYDERPRRFFVSRTVKGYSNSPEQNVAELQFALLKSKAADGDSFVVVGRCTDSIFEGIAPCTSVFICADREAKIRRLMQQRGLSEKDSIKKMERHDKKRRAYHDYFCQDKWGVPSTYDLCINSSVLGIEGTAAFIAEFISRSA